MAGQQDAGVYGTLLTSDEYLPGAMVLAHSLRDQGATHRLVAFITSETISAEVIDALRTVYDDVVPVPRIVNKSPGNLFLMNRADLIETFTKVSLWSQLQYPRIVFLDADVLPLRALDELFNLEAPFSAVPDVGWPDCFNSGVMVFNPNMGDYYALSALADSGISFDGADQGLLNNHFKNWNRLSFIYNCTPSANYQYEPAYRHFGSNIGVVHFIGKDKPWRLGRDGKEGRGAYSELLGRWWAVYDKHYKSSAPSTQVRPVTTPESKTFSAPSQPLASGISSFSNTAVTPPLEDRRSDRQPQPAQVSVVQQFVRGEEPWVSSAQAAPPPSFGQDYRPPAPEQVHGESAVQPQPSNAWEGPRQTPPPPPEKHEEPHHSAQIFPWEGRLPKPSRVFADSPPLVPVPAPETDTKSDSTAAEESASLTSSETPTPVDQFSSSATTVTSPSNNPWLSYNHVNVWDQNPAIERYVRSIEDSNRRGQVLFSRDQRRLSLRLVTDFPSESDRPSLPVTPAPIPRTHWAGEIDERALPPAKGVPNQENWDPAARLEELQRRQSETLLNAVLATNGSDQSQPTPLSRVKSPKPLDIPKRQMPESPSKEAAEKQDEKHRVSEEPNRY